MIAYKMPALLLFVTATIISLHTSADFTAIARSLACVLKFFNDWSVTQSRISFSNVAYYQKYIP